MGSWVEKFRKCFRSNRSDRTAAVSPQSRPAGAGRPVPDGGRRSRPSVRWRCGTARPRRPGSRRCPMASPENGSPENGSGELDPMKAEAFAGRMVDVLNGAALALMTSVGHQAGLFDAMAGSPPATSPDLAARTALDERYVREWLGGMVVGGIVEYDPADGTYRLPPEHAASLTAAAGPDNLAGIMQY